jgi:hypothetical protein
MRTDPTSRRRGPEKDRFRAARRAKNRADRKFRGAQLLFPWFAEFVATSTGNGAAGQTGRTAP